MPDRPDINAAHCQRLFQFLGNHLRHAHPSAGLQALCQGYQKRVGLNKTREKLQLRPENLGREGKHHNICPGEALTRIRSEQQVIGQFHAREVACVLTGLSAPLHYAGLSPDEHHLRPGIVLPRRISRDLCESSAPATGTQYRDLTHLPLFTLLHALPPSSFRQVPQEYRSRPWSPPEVHGVSSWDSTVPWGPVPRGCAPAKR